MVVFSGGTVNVVVDVDVVVVVVDDSVVVGVDVGNVIVVVDSAAVVRISVVLFAVDVGATVAEKTVVAEAEELVVPRSPSGTVELSAVRFLMCPSSAEVSDTADGDSAAVCIVGLAAGASTAEAADSPVDSFAGWVSVAYLPSAVVAVILVDGFAVWVSIAYPPSAVVAVTLVDGFAVWVSTAYFASVEVAVTPVDGFAVCLSVTNPRSARVADPPCGGCFVSVAVAVLSRTVAMSEDKESLSEDWLFRSCDGAPESG